MLPPQDDDSWRNIPWVSSETPQETGRFRSELAGKSYESGAWIQRPYPTDGFQRFRSFLVGSEQNWINPMNGSGHWNTASTKSPEYYGTARFRAVVFDLGLYESPAYVLTRRISARSSTRSKLPSSWISIPRDSSTDRWSASTKIWQENQRQGRFYETNIQLPEKKYST